MRKLILTLVAAGGLVLGGAAPAFAAPPNIVRTANTYSFLTSSTEQCGDYGTCEVDAQVNSDGSGQVCLDLYVDSDREEYDCTDVSASVLTVTGSGAVLQATDIQTSGGTVTVAAADQVTGASPTTSTGRFSSKDGVCTDRYSYKDTVTQVTGTITLNGADHTEAGVIGQGKSREISKNCPTAP